MPTAAELRAREKAMLDVPITEMTLRDWYAGQALIGIIAHHGAGTTDRYEVTAKASRAIADIMMRERAK